ncbi:hypothetical protein IAD21_00153 [Abditibacteriota bacterium]|nr:hypothetical protein IAD21_00153 [Abditibacteriota bacterium]
MPLLNQYRTASSRNSRGGTHGAELTGIAIPLLDGWRHRSFHNYLSFYVSTYSGQDQGVYRRFIAQEENPRLLRARKTQIELAFDLISKIAGTAQNHKQLPLQTLPNVRSFLLLCVVLIQLAMILNRVWGLPLRNISHMMTVLS